MDPIKGIKMIKSINDNLRKNLYDKILANNLNSYDGLTDIEMYKLFNLDDRILKALTVSSNTPSLKYSILVALKIAYYMNCDEVLEIIELIQSIDMYQEYKMKYIYRLLSKPLVLQSGNFLESAKTIASCQSEFVARNVLGVLTSSFLIDAKKQYEAAKIIKKAKESHNADYAAKVILNMNSQRNDIAFAGAQIMVEANNICACEAIYIILTDLNIINNVDALKAADTVKSFSVKGAELAKRVFSNSELVNSPYALDVAIFLNEDNPYDIEDYAYTILANFYLYDLGIAFNIAEFVKRTKSSLIARYICDLVTTFRFIPNIPSLVILESARLLSEATDENQLANIFKLLTNTGLIAKGLPIIGANFISSIQDSELQNMATAVLQNEYFINVNVAFALAKIIAGSYADSDIELITTACESADALTRIILELWQTFSENPEELSAMFNILSNLFDIDFACLNDAFNSYMPLENIDIVQKFIANAQRKGLKRSLKRKEGTSTDQFSIF